MKELAINPVKNVALALSGGGRTLKNLLDQETGKAYRISAIISSKPDSPGLQLARELGLPVFISHFDPKDSEVIKQELARWLELHAIDWIALGGFLKPFPIMPGFQQRIVNIHPALLPNYGGKGMYGRRVHEAVLAGGEAYSGASIHFVNEHYDEGTIIAQIRVPIAGLNNSETIAAQVFAAECKLYPIVLDKLCRGLLPLSNHNIFLIET